MLFDMQHPPQLPVLSVTQLTQLIMETLEASFPEVCVSGEISNVSRPRSGHVYLDLKDEASLLHAVIWRSTHQRLRFELEDGQQVVCHGAIDVYPPHGKYQLVVRRIEPVGQGALQLAFRQLHESLKAEGMFDARHKRPLPEFPRRIAVVTSPTGAAIRDFLHVAARRWPAVEILIVPAQVQGDLAAGGIAAAVKTAGRMRPPPDVIVVTRGGGSLEDLWSFNEEIVVRAIFACDVPVVSGVGHEVDVTLSDLVADVRAPTPSAAAELILPSEDEVRDRLGHSKTRLSGLLRSRMATARQRVDALAARRVFRRPLDWLRDWAQHLDELDRRSRAAVESQVETARQRLAAAAGQLESLSPLAVLARGYSLTCRQSDGQVIRNWRETSPGEQIVTRLSQGTLISRVEEVSAGEQEQRESGSDQSLLNFAGDDRSRRAKRRGDA